MKNLVASVQDRLKNLSRSEGIALNLILEDYANARLIARLSVFTTSTGSAYTTLGLERIKLASGIRLDT